LTKFHFETPLFSTVETCVPRAAIAYPLATYYKQYIHMSWTLSIGQNNCFWSTVSLSNFEQFLWNKNHCNEHWVL